MVYASNRDINNRNVNIVDTSTHSIIATISDGLDQPHAIAFTSEGKSAYVTNFGNHTVSVIDTKTHRIIATVRDGLSSVDVVISSN
nr:hypothetical protein [Bacillus sp. SM2101]